MNILKKIVDIIWPKCPSGMNHRVRLSVVENCLGNLYCWHPDCVLENRKVCEHLQHEQEEATKKQEMLEIAQEVWEKFIKEQKKLDTDYFQVIDDNRMELYTKN